METWMTMDPALEALKGHKGEQWLVFGRQEINWHETLDVAGMALARYGYGLRLREFLEMVDLLASSCGNKKYLVVKIQRWQVFSYAV